MSNCREQEERLQRTGESLVHQYKTSMTFVLRQLLQVLSDTVLEIIFRDIMTKTSLQNITSIVTADTVIWIDMFGTCRKVLMR